MSLLSNAALCWLPAPRSRCFVFGGGECIHELAIIGFKKIIAVACQGSTDL